ncbi:hypothetical protein LZ32DRAFT_435400 [Colletotrichum eremochloae]|nr:hypothetical protein LY78DRAFT_364248 [Colletotrichum sublineola]KAK2009026.1 hypothetical protein LZ32DRAFT_435400 [Colletotrichum eremochloae]
MSTRPRRATRRQAIVDSSDDDDEIANVTKRESSEEEFAPEPSKSPVRRPTRARKSKSVAPAAAAPAAPTKAAPRRRGRPKKNAEPETSEAPSTLEASTVLEEPSTVHEPSVAEEDPVTEEPSAVEEPSTVEAPTALDIAPSIEPTEVFDPDQTVTKTEPQSSPRSPRKSVAPRASTKSATPSAISKRKPSATPEPSRRQAEPLADITAASVNEQRSPPDDTQATFKPVRAMDTVLEKPMDIVLKSRNLAIPVVEDTTPKPRLVISYLILTNFKSYAGRQEVGPFHGSFSSVVGPNGSGKSNVIDSLLFVFGFRASKMRQGKLSALIHNSAQHPNLDHCEVSVHFREVMDQVRHPQLSL